MLLTVLDETHKRQVEEAMDTLSKGPEDLYKRPLTDPKHADLPPVPPVDNLLTLSTGGTGGKSPVW